jgi:hypothetical protein
MRSKIVLMYNNSVGIKVGSAVMYKGKNWLVHDVCKPCKLAYLYRAEFAPYKSKPGKKIIPIYAKAKFSSVWMLS